MLAVTHSSLVPLTGKHTESSILTTVQNCPLSLKLFEFVLKISLVKVILVWIKWSPGCCWFQNNVSTHCSCVTFKVIIAWSSLWNSNDLACILAIFNLHVWLNLTGFLFIFFPSWKTLNKSSFFSPNEVHLRGEQLWNTARSFSNHVHTAAQDYESKKTLARLISFSPHRLALNPSVLLLSSFIVPPCSRADYSVWAWYWYG